MNPYYREYSDFLAEVFPGGKVQKLSVNAGFTCPNRDGTKGRGGCTYCNNHSFSPDYTGLTAGDIKAQLQRGREFFARKYSGMRYVAYFQSYTGTYAEADRLMPLYEAAVSADDVVGLVIGTRPDCMPGHLLRELARMHAAHKPVIVEYGVESSHDRTLEAVNRCHTWEESVDALTRTREAGLYTGAHLIMGLPGETEDMMLQTVRRMVSLRPDTLKFHQLQILKGTRMSAQTPLPPTFTVEEYLDLCVSIVGILRGSGIAIDRFTASSPAGMLISPCWGLKNYEFVALLHKRLSRVM